MREEIIARFLMALVALALLLWCSPVGAQASEPAPAPSGADVPTDVRTEDGSPAVSKEPEPDFIAAKTYLPEWLLKNKREGRYVTGVPAIGFDTEAGFNGGVLLEIFDNGSREDPFFRVTPYRQNISIIATISTEGDQAYLFRLDQPYLLDSPYRLRFAGGYMRTDIANYFGVGNEAMDPLSFPGLPGVTFSRFDPYQDALDQEAGGFTYAKYNKYRLRQGIVFAALERDLLGGIVRPLIGLQASHVSIGDFTGSLVDAAGNVEAIQQPTKLSEDCAAGRIRGCTGGWDNFVKLGLTLDTRDFEPDPNSGLIAQLTAELATHAVGSSFTYQRLTSSVAGFVTPYPDIARLVLAGRVLYSMQFGEVPFFSLDTYAFNSRDRFGLGGLETLRGFRRDRFIGEAGALLNVEARWSITEWEIWRQHLRPSLVPFLDTGRVFDDVGATTFRGWRVGYGAGLRLAWNLATVIRFDFGLSGEDQLFYLDIGHQF